jgi:site-specific DNA-methyltransferase (adenine-specific)
MKPFFEHEKGVLYQGNNLDILKLFPDNHFDSVISDPPYNWKFMGKKWDSSFPTIEQCAEILRVTKPGGYLFAMIGNRTAHRLACIFEDAGWIILPSHIWLFAGAMPKGTDISKQIDKEKGLEREKIKKKVCPNGKDYHKYSKKRNPGYQRPWMDLPEGKQETLYETEPASPEAKVWEGWKTGIKTMFELILCAMKPLEGTTAQNALKWGVGGFNIEECRLPVDAESEPRQPWNEGRVKNNPDYTIGQTAGVWKTREKNYGKAMREMSTKGRYPGNVYLCEETAAALDRVSGVTKDRDRIIKAKNKRGKSSFFGYGHRDTKVHGGEGGASRFFWVGKAPQSERHKGLPDNEFNEHPTVKPIDLLRRLIRLTKTPTGGSVLDPWAGSGSVLVAAVMEGRHFTGIELDDQGDENCEKAKKRLIQEIGSLFI